MEKAVAQGADPSVLRDLVIKSHLAAGKEPTKGKEMYLPGVGKTKSGAQFGMVIMNEKRDTLDLDFQHRFALGNRNDIIWGVGYRYWPPVTNVTQYPPIYISETGVNCITFNSWRFAIT